MGNMQAENPDSKKIQPQPGKQLHSPTSKDYRVWKKIPQYYFHSVCLFSDFFSHSVLAPPGMCVKTVSEPDKQKIFVNICQSNSVPHPPDLSREELVELLQSEDPSSYRVPMSLGEPHMEVDNSM